MSNKKSIKVLNQKNLIKTFTASISFSNRPSCVFSSFFKQSRDSLFFTLSVKTFHNFGPATEKALSSHFLLVLGTCNIPFLRSGGNEWGCAALDTTLDDWAPHHIDT